MTIGRECISSFVKRLHFDKRDKLIVRDMIYVINKCFNKNYDIDSVIECIDVDMKVYTYKKDESIEFNSLST